LKKAGVVGFARGMEMGRTMISSGTPDYLTRPLLTSSSPSKTLPRVSNHVSTDSP